MKKVKKLLELQSYMNLTQIYESMKSANLQAYKAMQPHFIISTVA